ncbi:MAG: pilus assembly protein [Nitrospirales bacterium]|nr:pilus assembly protein [Nitrospira sp.]MDR4501792.1 pilus assembly protein [Nitrospirales bacterium]
MKRNQLNNRPSDQGLGNRQGCSWGGRLNQEEGAVFMEFALLLPILTTLIFGAIDFGNLIQKQTALDTISRDAARYGILRITPLPTETSIKQAVEQSLTKEGLNPTDATITVNGAGGSSGDKLEVRVQYPHEFMVISKLLPMLPNTMDLNSITVLRLE